MAIVLVGLLLAALLGVASLFLLTPRAPKPPPVHSFADFDAYAARLATNRTPPALEVLVRRGAAVPYHKAYGHISPDHGREAAVGDVYHYWSVTKLFTSVAALQLVERNGLRLDDPLDRYVPSFHPRLKNGNAAKVTIRQLLNHTSGVRDLEGPHLIGWIHGLHDPSVNQTRLVNDRLQPYQVLSFAPGANTRYSNTEYILLGAVIERVSGLTYEDYVRRNILAPLRMTSTDFVYTPKMAGRIVLGSHPLFHPFTPLLLMIHHDWFTRWVVRVELDRTWLTPQYTDYSPSTSLIGTAEDLGRFGQAIANGGELDGARILSAESVHLMTDQGGVKPSAERHQIGLGWQAWDRGATPFIGHSGGGPGFGTQLSILRDGTVIVVLANDTLIDREALTEALAAATPRG